MRHPMEYQFGKRIIYRSQKLRTNNLEVVKFGKLIFTLKFAPLDVLLFSVFPKLSALRGMDLG